MFHPAGRMPGILNEIQRREEDGRKGGGSLAGCFTGRLLDELLPAGWLLKRIKLDTNDGNRLFV